LPINTPMLIPSSTRPNSSRLKSLAKATTVLAMIMINVRPISRYRRSMVPMLTDRNGAARAAMMPGSVTIKPAWPALIPRSAATSLSTPTGRNSLVPRAKAPTATERSASQCCLTLC